MIDFAKNVLAVATLFAVSAALIGVGMERWMKNEKRWRLIRNAYVEGLKDARALSESTSTEGESNG